MQNATGLVGISDGYLNWALRYAARPRRTADAMYPLGYIAPAQTSADDRSAADKLQALGIDESRTLVWYIGSFGRQYDLTPVLQGARALLESKSDVQFVISGDGELGDRWHSLAEGLTNVVFTGWINADEINWLRAKAAIGLQPYILGAPQGLANKLFEYLSAGIPVLSSLTGENQDLIDSHACGLSYKAGNTEDFLQKLSCLLSSADERMAMGQRGKALFEQQFDGKTVFDGLIHHLEKVARKA
jgi:glycosyltransferase involved in cell wall biosynthesis